MRNDDARSNTRQRKVHRSAHPRLAVAASHAFWLSGNAHARDQFARQQCQGLGAVIHVEIVQWQVAWASAAQNIDAGIQCNQRGREITTPGRMTVRTLRCHVAGVAAELQTIVVGLPPPLALVVEDATGIEAQIAPQCGHRTVARPGNRSSGLGQHR